MPKPPWRNTALGKRIEHILVIDEGSPGHLTQSRGLATALAQACQAKVQTCSVRLKTRGLLRPLLRTLCKLSTHGLPEVLLSRVYQLPSPHSWPKTDLIVTSGGRGLYYAYSLARRLQCPLVYCGDPSPLPAHWCDVILSPLPTHAQTRSIKTDLLLTGVSPSDIAGKGEIFRNAFNQTGAQYLAALLIGGDSRSHHYTPEDWQALINGVNQLGSQGWRWLITTSRRTPQQVERQLQQALRPEFLVDTVWWHQQASPMVQAYLDAADLVLVTRDSMSMLSEAISANKPTLALAPNCVYRSEFIDAIVNTQIEQKRLREVPLSLLATEPLSHVFPSPPKAPSSKEYAAKVLDLLNYKPHLDEMTSN